MDNRAAVGMTACLSDNILGDEPASDGAINRYDLCGGEYRGFGSPELIAKSRPPRNGKYMVVFVNGMSTDRSKHRNGAGLTAAVSGGPVQGLFNATDSFVEDFIQCGSDKLTTKGAIESLRTDKPAGNASSSAKLGGNANGELKKRIVEYLARKNKATACLFEYLADHGSTEFRIVAHSQGNLITNVAIMALQVFEGDSSVKQRIQVYSLAPPVGFWADGFPTRKFLRSNDPITWIGGNFGGDPYARNQDAAKAKVLGDLIGKAVDGLTTGEIVELTYRYMYEQSVAEIKDAMASHGLFAYVEHYWDELVGCFP